MNKYISPCVMVFTLAPGTVVCQSGPFGSTEPFGIIGNWDLDE